MPKFKRGAPIILGMATGAVTILLGDIAFKVSPLFIAAGLVPLLFIIVGMSVLFRKSGLL
jgi:hypothetical protein